MMPRKKRRSPQEKKALSLKKDRRNDYGESTTAARKSIPSNKARANRAVRHAAKQALRTQGQDASDVTERKNTLKKWKKLSDTPLGEHIEVKLKRRKASHGARVRRIGMRKNAIENDLPNPVIPFQALE